MNYSDFYHGKAKHSFHQVLKFINITLGDIVDILTLYMCSNKASEVAYPIRVFLIHIVIK